MRDPSLLVRAGSWELRGWDEQLRGLVEAESSSLLWAPRGATKSLSSRARLSPTLGVGALTLRYLAGAHLRAPTMLARPRPPWRCGGLSTAGPFGSRARGGTGVRKRGPQGHKGGCLGRELPGAGRKRCTSHSHSGAPVGTGEERGVGGPLGALRGSAQKIAWPPSRSSSRSAVGASRRGSWYSKRIHRANAPDKEQREIGLEAQLHHGGRRGSRQAQNLRDVDPGDDEKGTN